MRKLSVFLILMLFLSLPVSAHSGKTDSNGGHTDKATGEYHWHHGEPAHQHYDIDGDGTLDCPLNASAPAPTQPAPTIPVSSSNIVRTSYSNSGPTSGSNSSSNSKNASVADVSSSTDLYGVPFVLATVVLIFMSLGYLVQISQLKRKESEIRSLSSDIRKLKQDYADLLEDIQAKEENLDYQLDEMKGIHRLEIAVIQDQLRALRDSLSRTYGPDYLLQLSGAPAGTRLDANGFPIFYSRSLRCDIYTFCVTDHKYHRPNCSCLKFSTTVNAVKLHTPAYRHLHPCQRCNPQLPDLDWYSRYRALESFFDNYSNFKSTQ